MTDKTISDLAAASAFNLDSEIEVVTDPGGTPASEKVTGQQVVDLVVASVGPPTGRATGQVLRKASAADHDTEWATLSGGVQNNFTATSAPTVNDDSGDGYAVGSFWCWAARGLVWQCYDASSGAAVWALPNRAYTRFLAGNWILLEPPGARLTTGANPGANVISYDFFELDTPAVVSDLGFYLAGTQAGQNAKVALYRHNWATGRPAGTPVAETGDISTASSGPLSADVTGSDKLLVPDGYWKAIWCSHATPTWMMAPREDVVAVHRVGSATLGNVLGGAFNRPKIALTSSETYGAWPDASGETFTEQAALNYGVALAMKAV